MHYYQFNIADYRKDTAHLSLLEHGVYRQLLDWYYISEKPIPKETQVVFRRLSARTQEEQNAILIVLDEFFIESENAWNHKKCDEEIKKYKIKAKISKENGKLGGRPKKTQGVISGLSKKTQEKANSLTQEPINSLKPLKEKDKKENPDFDRFWSEYPKKQGKHESLKAWKKKKPPINSVLKALEWQKNSQQWIEGYIPNPATYINQERWEDEPQNANAPPSNRRNQNLVTEQSKRTDHSGQSTVSAA